MSEAFLIYSDYDRFEIRCPNNKAFSEEFCAIIPEEKREWLYNRRSWRFTSEHLLAVNAVAKKYFSVNLDTETLNYITKKFEEQTKTAPNNPHAVLYLTENAPFWLVEKVYKILLMDSRSEFLHQDRGGNPVKNGELNDAVNRIRNPKTD